MLKLHTSIRSNTDKDKASSVTTDDEWCGTPTLTSESESLPSFSIPSCPWKGGIYLIREHDPGLYVTLKEGKLGLSPRKFGYDESVHDLRCGSLWECVEHGSTIWLGFKNTVSGTFLGRNSYPEFIATAQYHDKWEWFCAREHPHGGHILLVTYGSRLLPMRKGGKGQQGIDP